MKALVLSGGTGTRLRPFTFTRPKQLIPLANEPVLAQALQNVRELGIDRIAVVVGPGADLIARVIGDGSCFGARITYLHQDQPRGLAHCVRLAREFLGDDDFVMYLGDNLFRGDLASLAEPFRRARPPAHLVVRQVPDARPFGVAEVDADGTVRRLVEKPRAPRSNLAVLGLYFFTPAIHEAVAAISAGPRGELEITDAVQWLISQGHPVSASRFDGYWRDIGTVEDALAGNRRILSELVVGSGVRAGVDAESTVSGPVVLGAGARVVRSRVEGPAVIGAGSLVEDSVIGPYSSIGARCVVRATVLGDSIVLDEVSIDGVAGVESSLIGTGASIGARGYGGRGHRLIVGDGARIDLR